MSIELKPINPLTYPNWDNLLLTNPNYSFFHSSTWARVLSESYHYKPLYFAMIDQGNVISVIPFMEIDSPFTGKRGVSLPFTDYCEPILSKESLIQDVVTYLTKYGKKAGWKSFELRGGKNVPKAWVSSAHYYRHTLNLNRDEEEIFSSFRSSTKRNIKKAKKERVKISKCGSLESMSVFYRLNCMTRRSHGLPPQPYSFFKQVFKHVISKDRGSVILASYKDKIISGAIYFHFGEKALYKYGASDTHYQHLRANNLVMWEAIKWYSQNGYKSFCFGRTDPGNSGLLQYKRGWSAREGSVRYSKYDIKREAFVRETTSLFLGCKKILQSLPIPLLRITGSILYKHIG